MEFDEQIAAGKGTQRGMAYSEQQTALQNVRTIFGKTGFTENTIHYRRVGCMVGRREVWAIGDTWNEAIEALKVKVGR